MGPVMSCTEPLSIPGLATRRAANHAAALPVVLVLDGDPFWRRLVARKLSPGAVVRPASTVEEADRILALAPLAAAVVELDRPYGEDSLRRIRLAPRPLPTLVVSASDSVLCASAANALGAEFASKHEPMSALSPRIERLVTVVSRAADPLDELVAELAVRGGLTRAEREALEVFLRTGNRACLAAELGIAETSVKSRVRAVCRKLGLSHLAEVYRTLFALSASGSTAR